MRKTVFILLVTAIAVPVASIWIDQPLTELQYSALVKLLWLYAATSMFTFLVSTITRNYSQVDKLWSIMPIFYVWMMAFDGGMELRQMVMAALISLWGMRLTWNFSRKGGYSWRFWEGEEDYRWAVLRQNGALANPVVWALFNFFFISFYQMGLVLLITLPMLLTLGGKAAFGAVDVLASALIIAFLIIETVADNQQWNYQKAKHLAKQSGQMLEGAFARGFVAEGLWAVSRHPNYWAEQSIWAVFYLFSVAATGRTLNWTLTGALLLMLLFQGSADFSEGISASKYPAYKDYQRKVSRFIPNLFRRKYPQQ